MATISRHRDKWKCQVRISGYPHVSKSFQDRDKAEAWGKQTEDELKAGTYEEAPKEPPPKTIKEMLRRYLAEVSPTKAREGDADTARIQRLQGVFGAYSVHTLQSTRITRYKHDRLAQGAAAQTVLHELVLLHHAYVIACEEWGLVLDHAIPRTKRPKLPAGRKFRIPNATAKAIRLATTSKQLGDVVDFAIETCMRRSEITGLDPARVSLTARTVYLPDTKNGEARVVPLTARAMEILRPRVDAGMNPVFPIQANSLTRAFCRAVRRAGHAELRFHDTRHEGISRLFEQGYSVLEVARISGHKTLSQLDRYAHLDVHFLIRKMEELEDAA